MQGAIDMTDFALDFAQKKGVSYAEARLEFTSGNSFMVKNGIPQMSAFDKLSGLGMRFLIDKALGFVSVNELTKENVKIAVENAIRITRRASKIKEEINLAEEKAHNHKYKVKEKIKFEDISPKEKMNELLEAEKQIKSLNMNVPGRYFSLSDSKTTEYLITSEGTKILATVPKTSFFYILTIQHQQKTAQRYWQYGNAGGFEFVKKWNIPKITVNEVKAIHKNLKEGVKPPKGRLDVVCAPQVVGIMVHESVGHPYEADRILGREAAQAGESFVEKSMINTRIGNEIVSVADDPTLENSYGFYLFDNEGVKARKKMLMKKGIINEFLHNRQTGYEMGTISNGSSRAIDYDKESIVRMSNTFLMPGEHSEEELVEDVKKGILMKNFMEWNIDDKRYNQKYVGAEAYLIENGKITKPVISPMIEISTPKLWSSVDAIAKNIEYHAGNCGKGEPMQAIPVWFGGPSMKLKNIHLTN